MANKYISPSDRNNVDRLRFCLISKILEEWETKWSTNHGNVFNGINELPSKNQFFEDLKVDIITFLEQKQGKLSTEDLISKDTILRFLDENYKYGFSKKTLDKIAFYCGFENWKQFKIEAISEKKSLESPQTVNVFAIVTTNSNLENIKNANYIFDLSQRRKKWSKNIVLLSVLSFLAVLLYLYFYKYLPFRGLTSKEIKTITFKVAKMSYDYNPSIVTFDYDFSKTNLDSLRVFFSNNRGSNEQNYETLRTPKGQFSFDFYKAGIHSVFLFHQNQLLKGENVFIKSHGWSCWYSTTSPNWTNTNIPYKDFYQNGNLFLHPLKIHNPTHRNNYVVKNLLAYDFKVNLDSVCLEYDIKYSPDDFAISCYDHVITLADGNNNRFSINFNREGCHYSTPQNSMLGFDSLTKTHHLFLSKIFYEWSKVKLEFKNNHLKVWINNKLLADNPYKKINENLLELSLQSKGSAMYDNVKLSNSHTNRVIYFDDFNTIPISKNGY